MKSVAESLEALTDYINVSDYELEIHLFSADTGAEAFIWNTDDTGVSVDEDIEGSGYGDTLQEALHKLCEALGI